MPFLSRPQTPCRHCGEPRKRYFASDTGRFKSYGKTCGSQECRSISRSAPRPSQVYKQKICEHCEISFTPESGRQRWCKICVPHKRATAMMQRYDLSWPKYLMAIAEPCPLCGSPATVIDHDHQTGKTRSALCCGCNVALGRAEIPGWIERVRAYLGEHESAIR